MRPPASSCRTNGSAVGDGHLRSVVAGRGLFRVDLAQAANLDPEHAFEVLRRYARDTTGDCARLPELWSRTSFPVLNDSVPDEVRR